MFKKIKINGSIWLIIGIIAFGIIQTRIEQKEAKGEIKPATPSITKNTFDFAGQAETSSSASASVKEETKVLLREDCKQAELPKEEYAECLRTVIKNLKK